jgi:hypothetical protein
LGALEIVLAKARTIHLALSSHRGRIRPKHGFEYHWGHLETIEIYDFLGLPFSLSGNRRG